MYRFIYILVCFFFSFPVFSQTDTIAKRYVFPSIGARFHKGFIIPHSESIKSISSSHPWIIELDYAWHFATQKAWDYCYCFPRIGITASYINFDNPSILGSGYALVPYVEPFFSAHRKMSTSLRFAVGAVYLNNVYNAETNPLNLFYSTPVSFLLSINLSVNYRFEKTWGARLTASYNHISNGGNRLPNKGINFPTLGLGIDYAIKPSEFRPLAKKEKNENIDRTSFKVAILGTSRKPFPEETSRYWLYGVAANWSYLFGRLSAFTAGAEWVNDNSLRETLKRSGSGDTDHNRAGILVGHEFQVGRFRFSQQLGVYMYSPAKAYDPVYQRWGLEFLVKPSIFVGVNLKAHRHVADFMDFRAGYVFK